MATSEVHALARSRGDQVLQQHNLKEHISLAWKQLRTRGLRGHDLQLLEIMPSKYRGAASASARARCSSDSPRVLGFYLLVPSIARVYDAKMLSHGDLFSFRTHYDF